MMASTIYRSLRCAALVGCAALMPSVAEAVEGGYISGVAYGDMFPSEMDEGGQVAMLEADVQIDLWTSYAEVKAAYRMKNLQDRPVKVRFGSPNEGVCLETGVRNYRVVARGAELDARREFLDMDALTVKPQGSRGFGAWIMSELEFAPGEELDLMISCRVPYLGKVDFESDIFDCSNAMIYRLSSAAMWSGPVGKGKMTVRLRSVEADEVEMKAPANRFKLEGDAWVWSFENLEPTRADDLLMVVKSKMYKLGPSGLESLQDSPPENRVQKRGSVWMRGLPTAGMKVTASSEQTALPPSAEGLPREFKAAGVLRDGTGERRVWGEGTAGDGTGESITFTLPAPTKLAGFDLIPGYSDRDDRPGFKEYNSVAEMEVIVNDTWKKTVVFQHDNLSGRWVSLVQCPEEAKTVRMVIRKVYPGSKHDVTCISNVSFYTLLDKEPKIDPCR